MEQGPYRGPRSLFSQQSDLHRPSGRPLSDIRELTEPSLFEAPLRIHHSRAAAPPAPKRSTSARRPAGRGPPHVLRNVETAPCDTSKQARRSEDGTSIYSIPLGNIPPRSSSKEYERKLAARPKPSLTISREPAVLLSQPHAPFLAVENTRQGLSPIKGASSRKTSTDPQKAPRIPSKTIIKRENPSTEHLLDSPNLPHPRLKVDLLLAAPLFVGGSSVEGVIRIVVDDAEKVRHRKMLTLERVSLDLIGVEEIMHPKARRKVFLSLGNEVVDTWHPPPEDMVDDIRPLTSTTRSWMLIPSVSTLPFLLTLPLTVGPPPFDCKYARIRYILCATLYVKDAGRALSVRCSQETALLSVQDPERALVSLPSPLTATEHAVIRGASSEHIAVTAGLHRQVWVSGTNLFTDVHIVNDSHKTVRKLELRLDRILLCYGHAAAATLETSASGARMFDQKERMTVAKSIVRPGIQGWSGVMPHTTVLRTCGLEVPRDHASIPCHSLFEVRYYLFISAYTTRSKIATVQLPVHIIHMNSLDVPTNTVAQVAAAIEEKEDRHDTLKSRHGQRTRLQGKTSMLSLQGRAFAAPRKESLDRFRARQAQEGPAFVTPSNASSHRRLPPLRRMSSTFSFKTPSSKRRGRVFQASDAAEISRQIRHMRKTSQGSSTTNHSVPRGRHPTRKSSALGFYLQEVDLNGAKPRHAGSARSSQRPSTDTRRAPSSARGGQISTGDKGKGHLVD